MRPLEILIPVKRRIVEIVEAMLLKYQSNPSIEIDLEIKDSLLFFNAREVASLLSKLPEANGLKEGNNVLSVENALELTR